MTIEQLKQQCNDLINARKLATSEWHSKMRYMEEYLCGKDEQGDFVMADFNRSMP